MLKKAKTESWRWRGGKKESIQIQRVKSLFLEIFIGKVEIVFHDVAVKKKNNLNFMGGFN